MEQLQPPSSPIQEIKDPVTEKAGIRLLIKRDDERYLPAYPGDRAFGGNKWRKLQYNLQVARAQGFEKLLTFGGAFSNHIAATASAGVLFGFQTIGIIRGDKGIDNPTLRHARRCDMQLQFMDRSTYRRKDSHEVREALLRRYGTCYLIPEGGTNETALSGCRDLAAEIRTQCGSNPPDFYCLSCGTGGTLAGFTTGTGPDEKVLGFPALKGNFLEREIEALLNKYAAPCADNWELVTGYHFGGYARYQPELIHFIKNFRKKHGIVLDPLYTGKMLFGVFDLAGKGFFSKGSTVMAIHTGGLQGIAGFNERHETTLPED